MSEDLVLFEKPRGVRLVTEAKLKRLKIDVVNELHEIRRKHAGCIGSNLVRALIKAHFQKVYTESLCDRT